MNVIFYGRGLGHNKLIFHLWYLSNSMTPNCALDGRTNRASISCSTAISPPLPSLNYKMFTYLIRHKRVTTSSIPFYKFESRLVSVNTIEVTHAC